MNHICDIDYLSYLGCIFELFRVIRIEPSLPIQDSPLADLKILTQCLPSTQQVQGQPAPWYAVMTKLRPGSEYVSGLEKELPQKNAKNSAEIHCLPDLVK